MSLVASRWAWNARAGGAKVMLAALAEHADQSGYCFPSLQRLAIMCDISESTAHRMLKVLVSRELIAIERRFNTNGSCRSNGYRLAIGDHPVNLTGWGVTVAGGTVSAVTGGGVAHDRVTTTERFLYETLLLPADGKTLAPQTRFRDGRHSRYLCFPKAVLKRKREALATQVGLLSFDNAQDVLDELAGRMKATRVRDPVGYCARLVERLKCGQFHLVAGLEVAKKRQAEQREQLVPDRRECQLARPSTVLQRTWISAFRRRWSACAQVHSAAKAVNLQRDVVDARHGCRSSQETLSKRTSRAPVRITFGCTAANLRSAGSAVRAAATTDRPLLPMCGPSPLNRPAPSVPDAAYDVFWPHA